MLAEALLALTMVVPRVDAGIAAARSAAAAISLPQAPEPRAPGLPYFSVAARAVSNWRDEAGAGLTPRSLALVARFSASDPAFVARCVKLNNYWCIKQARWNGELGGDAEGHTGFATAADGADAAAQLLRRYYRHHNRRTALAIVRRWAPAECGPVAGKTGPGPAPRAFAGTLRARFLAHHAPGGGPRRVAAAGAAGLRVQPWSALARLSGRPRVAPRMAAPLPAFRPVADIATGIGAASAPTVEPKSPPRKASAPVPRALPVVHRFAPTPPATRARVAEPAALLSSDRLVAESAALPSIVAGLPAGSLLDLRVPAPFCGSDETRIRNYASRIAASVGLTPEDDLGLFEADGRPSARLALVMLAMSSVELGSLRASPALIEAAVARLAARTGGPTSASASD